ncbi:MAG: ExbD/TolR family protein [Luteolibacter sp.]
MSALPGEPNLDISSLIDVCFLLLIYFLITSTISPKEEDLSMALPSPGITSPKQPIPPLLIRVDSGGVIFTGTGTAEQQLDSVTTDRELPLLLSQLSLYKSALQSAGETPLVRLNVDNDASQQRVVDVLNALATTGISSVTFTDFLSQL